MKPNPFSDNPDTRTDVDTAKGRRLADDRDVKPVMLMAYSPVDDDAPAGSTEDRWELKGDTTVGRKIPADIAVPDTCMSKEHFRILTMQGAAPGAFYIEDLGSTNGTSINGTPLAENERHRLTDGALIRAGHTLFVFHEDGESLQRPKPSDTFGIAGRFHAAPLVERLRKMGDARTNVLLSGPSGVGKELAAHALARLAGRKLLIHNAAKFGTEDEAASTLFGISIGTFTGVGSRAGLIESADGKMLFLDEAHTLPKRIQKSLLRVVEDWFTSRIGETIDRQVDVRFIFASNDPSSTLGLEHDLLARLHVVRIPPLCERIADIPSIFRYLMETMLHKENVDRAPVLKHLTVEHYEALCLNGFETENTRGLIKLCIDIVNEIKAGASPEQAVKMIFKSLAKKTPVIGAGKELVAASSKGRVQDTEPIHEYDAKIVMKQCNVDLVTLNLIKDAYYKRSGVVSEIAAYLKEQNGLRLSSHRISKALDAMNLPRLKRPR